MRLGIFVLGILMLGFFVSGEVSVDPEIFEKFDSGEKEIEVIVARDKVSSGISTSSSLGKASRNELVETKINEKELVRLLAEEDVVGIELLRYFKIYLDDSVGLVNASSTWNLKVSGINLTGNSRTVCVIDTGINYSHPDILGRNLTACNIDCIDGACIENCSEEDLNGHGTHVAGIVGAGGGIDGIAKGVGLIGVKVFPGASTSEATTIGIINAIDWCVDNSENYNISVISMSLGTGTLYSSVCDSNFGETFVPAVSAAFVKNISVVAASGNDGNVTAIGSPACLSKVIGVGGADKSGGMYSDGNRNSLVKLLGIATGVNSTDNGGGYLPLTGTSMATPMVSGAIAIINQLLYSTSRTMTPLEIESSLNETGFNIYDAGSGRNYSRINLYDAILSLDIDTPNVTLVSPVDNHVNLSVNQSFVCNASDWQLANVTFRIWNSSGILYNESSEDLTGTENETSFDLVNLNEGQYDWNCFVEDDLGNLGSASSNFSLTVGGLEVDLDSPVNGSYTNLNETNFSCNAQSDVAYELANMSFMIWNSSGSLNWSETRNISGLDNTTIFNYTFLSEGDYVWTCVAFNNNSDEGGGVNFSVEYDSTAPVISNLEVSVTSNSATVSWTTNEEASTVSTVTWVGGGGGGAGGAPSYTLSHSVTHSSLSSSTSHNYTARSCDRASNCANVSGSFATSATPVSSGGGGGGGSSINVINVKAAEFWEGKSGLLRAKDRMNFNLVSGSHSLRMEKVGIDFAEVVVTSDPIYLNLSVGEEVKLNLSSADYYDLVVKLNSISNGNANVSVKRIFELIVDEVDEDLNESDYVEDDRVFRVTDKEKDWRGFVLVGIVAFILVIVLLGRKSKKLKSSKTGKRKLKNKNGKKNKKIKT